MFGNLLMMMGANAADEEKVNALVDSFSAMPEQLADIRARQIRIENKLDLLLDIKNRECEYD